MFSSITITPQAVELVFPFVFLASYVKLRCYRDPMQCRNECLHLPGDVCHFYHETSGDRRNIQVVPVASPQMETEKPKFPYNIYRGFLAVLSVATLIPAIFWVAYRLRQIRLGFEQCNCKHSKNCPLGVERIVPPPGCETWTYRDRGYDAPNRLEWVPGIKIAASPARVIHLQNKHFEREKRREKMAKRSLRNMFRR